MSPTSRSKALSSRIIRCEQLFDQMNVSPKEQDVNITEEQVIKILRIQPERRNKLQISNLIHYLSKITFFKDYVKNGQQEVVNQCAKQFLSKYYPKGKNIITAGEIGNEFFIILKGKVGVYLSKVGEFQFTFQELCIFLKRHTGFVKSLNHKPVKKSMWEFVDLLDSDGKLASKSQGDVR